MSEVYRNGQFEADAWKTLSADDPLPEHDAVFVPLERWQNDRGTLKNRMAPLGLIIRAGENVEAVIDELSLFKAVAVEFPKFADGRSYSTARILHEQLDFDGEIRAIGDVLLDQIPFMRRCGVTAFEITHEPTRRALEDGHNPEVVLHTQPVGLAGEVPVGTRPWLRRGVGKSTLKQFMR
ncbi:MAG: DUF934 domain-containing protein [Stappiaceae bacterium]